MATSTETTESSVGRHADLHHDGRRIHRRPTLDDVWTSLAVVVPALLGLLARLPTIDLAYHLRIGSLIRAQHAIPRVDELTFGADGRAWVDQQWGAQVLLSAVHDVGGFSALVALRGLCAAAVGISIYASCRSKQASARTACALTVTAYIVAMPYLALRPQLFGAVLFAACILVLAVRRRHPGAMWAVPLITALWVNLHGSFVLAVAVIAFAMLEDVVQRRRTWKTTAAVAGATIAATLLNPFGTDVWAYVTSLATDPIIRDAVEEWRPPTLETLGGALFIGAVVALGGILARRGRRLSWLDLAWLISFSFLAFSAQRNVLWWIIAVMPLVASMLSDRSSTSETPDGARIVNATIISLLALSLMVALPWVRPRRPIVSGMPPAPLVVAADRQLPADARMFVYQPWASWVEFASPDVRVFVDSRIEIFPESVWQEYQAAVAGGHDYRKILDSWGVDAVMLPTDGTSLVGALTEDPTWTLTYEDERGLLFIRDLVDVELPGSSVE